MDRNYVSRRKHNTYVLKIVTVTNQGFRPILDEIYGCGVGIAGGCLGR